MNILLQVRDARAALDALREEEKERRRLEAEHAERIRQAQVGLLAPIEEVPVVTQIADLWTRITIGPRFESRLIQAVNFFCLVKLEANESRSNFNFFDILHAKGGSKVPIKVAQMYKGPSPIWFLAHEL